MQMGHNTKENGLMTDNMEKEKRPGQMVLFLREDMKMDLKMD